MRVWPGQPYPLGATWTGLGVNFAIFFSHGTHYSLQGRMLVSLQGGMLVVVFTLDGNGCYRRASDQADVADEMALG